MRISDWSSDVCSSDLYYVSLLPDSRIDAILPYSVETPGGKPGDVMSVEFTLAGQSYMALNGGPYFQFTPAISFFVDCADQAEVDRLWDALSDGGSPMQCGWLPDPFGVAWAHVCIGKQSGREEGGRD